MAHMQPASLRQFQPPPRLLQGRAFHGLGDHPAISIFDPCLERRAQLTEHSHAPELARIALGDERNGQLGHIELEIPLPPCLDGDVGCLVRPHGAADVDPITGRQGQLVLSSHLF
ncbi:hypothetical protein [Halomonas sp. AOP35-4E-18]|uniref:hypothetical protein n=1 Tax=Halomonas sp. AOP35-4E-18 TaxID=3457686 RepID=UPI004034E782